MNEITELRFPFFFLERTIRRTRERKKKVVEDYCSEII